MRTAERYVVSIKGNAASGTIFKSHKKAHLYAKSIVKQHPEGVDVDRLRKRDGAECLGEKDWAPWYHCGTYNYQPPFVTFDAFSA